MPEPPGICQLFETLDVVGRSVVQAAFYAALDSLPIPAIPFIDIRGLIGKLLLPVVDGLTAAVGICTVVNVVDRIPFLSGLLHLDLSGFAGIPGLGLLADLDFPDLAACCH